MVVGSLAQAFPGCFKKTANGLDLQQQQMLVKPRGPLSLGAYLRLTSTCVIMSEDMPSPAWSRSSCIIADVVQTGNPLIFLQALVLTASSLLM